MNLFYIFLALYLMSSNTIYAVQMKNDSYSEVMSVINIYSKEIKKEKNIELRGYGLHYADSNKVFDGKIHEINLSYSIDQNMKINEARILFYSLVDELLNRLNRKESIQDYFFHHPVSYSDLYFRLNFDYDNEKHLSAGDISMIAILENKIKYFIVEEDGGNAGTKTGQIVPDVQIVTGFSSKTQCITKKLPEVD